MYHRKDTRKVLIPSKITLSPPRKSRRNDRKQLHNNNTNTNTRYEMASEISQMKHNILKQVDQKSHHTVRLKVSSLREIKKPTLSVKSKSYHHNNETTNLISPPQHQSIETGTNTITHIQEQKNEDIQNDKNLDKLEDNEIVIERPKSHKHTIRTKKQEQCPSLRSLPVKENNIFTNSLPPNDNIKEVDNCRALSIANLIRRFRNAPPTKRGERRKKTLQEIDEMLAVSSSNELTLNKNNDNDNVDATTKMAKENIVDNKNEVAQEENCKKGDIMSVNKTNEPLSIPAGVSLKSFSTNDNMTEDIVGAEQLLDTSTTAIEIDNTSKHSASSNTSKTTKISRRWYFIDQTNKDSRSGPFATQEMCFIISEKGLGPLTPVWCQGLPDWMPISSVPAFDLFYSSTPPAPSTKMQQRPRPPSTRRPKKQSIKTLNTSIDLKNHTKMLEDDIREENKDTAAEMKEEATVAMCRVHLSGDDTIDDDDEEEYIDINISEDDEDENIYDDEHKKVVDDDKNKKVVGGDKNKNVVDDDGDEDIYDDIEEHDVLSSVGINTDSIQVESRGTDVMTLSSATQVNLSAVDLDDANMLVRQNASANISILNNYSVDIPDINISARPIKLENPIVESLEMLQSLISRVSKEKCILQEKKLGVHKNTSVVKHSVSNNVNGLIKSLINTVENERSRIASLRLDT